jgi:asparagine synthase (glutamine-hydrolysing)
MCGIVGFSGQKNSDILGKMLESIKHRGPDGEGKFENELFSIGMRRLSIIDPQTGWQPIWNEDQTVGIIMNGEIYNYQELWDTLISRGHEFRTDHSDTETVLHGYEEWGSEVLQRLRGMFAFCIIDLNKNELFIARDRIGIKPLYYIDHNNKVTFSSEIKALLLDPTYEPKVNKSVLYEYLVYRTHDHREDTFFKGIKRLLPGHFMRINKSGNIIENKKYWNPEISLEFSSSKPDSEYANELREELIDSIRHHVISDVPVGVLLSGGLDSTGVACVMHKLMKEEGQDLHTKKLLTFSSIYPDDPMDERKYIDEVTKFIPVEDHYVEPTLDGFWTEIDDWIYTQEEPTISSAPYAIYSVMREASKYVKVMLSGQGGDELFAGYIPYFSSYLSSAKQSGKVLQMLREGIQGFDLYYSYLKGRVKEKLSPENDKLEMSILLNKDAFNISQDKKSFEYSIDKNLNQRLFQDLTMFSVPNEVRYEDKNSMAFSVESRVPLLDHKLVEYVLKLPIDQKIKYGWNRFVYRNALKGLIPESTRTRRKKIGFTTPVVKWMQTRSDIILDIFNSPEFNENKLFNAELVRTEFRAWLNGTRKADGLIFWRILNTALWMKRFNIT